MKAVKIHPRKESVDIKSPVSMFSGNSGNRSDDGISLSWEKTACCESFFLGNRPLGMFAFFPSVSSGTYAHKIYAQIHSGRHQMI